MKYQYFLFLPISLGWLCFFIFRILFKKYPLYFIELYASRIGHLLYNHEIYKYFLKQEGLSPGSSVFIIFQKPSNQFLLSFLKRNNSKFSYIVFPRYIKPVILYFIRLLETIRIAYLIPWEKIHQRDHIASILLKPYVLSIADSKNFQKLTHKYLIVDKKYVSMHNRDSKYLTTLGLLDGNYHDYRDFCFNDLSELSKFLSSENVISVRHGAIQERPNSLTFPLDFVDLTMIERRSSCEDVLLIANCLFFIGTCTGFSHLPWLFRKPQLLINYIPFRLDEVCIWTKGSLILPKLIKEISSSRYLSFREILSLDYNIHEVTCPFKKKGLEVIDNSPEDILEAGKQMYLMCIDSYYRTPYFSHLQSQFWLLVSDLKGASSCITLQICIPDSFLDKYSYLLY